MCLAATTPYAIASQHVGIRLDRVANALVAFAVFLGGFVIFEPAPYEVFLAFLLCVFFLLGLSLPKAILPCLLPVATFSIGGIISSFMIDDYSRGLFYNAVTFFLGLTTVFFAVLIQQDMGRLRLFFRAYVLAAFVTSCLGILGYFGVPGFEIFTKYERASGAFADPNVFAPFLVAPILYLIYGILRRSAALAPFRIGLLLAILIGELLAGSRAGWVLTTFSVLSFYTLMLVNEPDPILKAKYILMGVVGAIVAILGLIVALQVDAVWELITERAKVFQDYDAARIGRFARHGIGFELAFGKPFGIGSLEFGRIYGEDEHNVYLRSLLSYGWLGFVSWVTLILWPLIAGFKSLFLDRPWRPYFQIAYVTFLGHLFIAWVIDIDHWRHFYLLMGLIWGGILLEKSLSARDRMSRRERLVASR